MAASPCSGCGSAEVCAQVMTLGLNVAPLIRLKEMTELVPVAVCTVICELFAVPDGTAVTM